MNAKVFVLLVTILGLAALSGCGGDTQARGEGSAGDEGSEEMLTLRIEGSPETEFSGTCAVGDAEPEEIGGRNPQTFTYDLEGRPFECEISSDGDLEVTLTHGNDRSVQRISGGTLNLAYENGRISSSTSSSQVVSSSGGSDDTGDVRSEPRDVSGFDEVELRGLVTSPSGRRGANR